MWSHWFRSQVDLFTTAFIHRLPLYVSPAPDPTRSGTSHPLLLRVRPCVPGQPRSSVTYATPDVLHLHTWFLAAVHARSRRIHRCDGSSGFISPFITRSFCVRSLLGSLEAALQRTSPLGAYVPCRLDSYPRFWLRIKLRDLHPRCGGIPALTSVFARDDDNRLIVRFTRSPRI